jgi:hypothetical protein
MLRVYFTIGHTPGGALRVCLRLFMHSPRGGNGTDDIVITILVYKCLLSPWCKSWTVTPCCYCFSFPILCCSRSSIGRSIVKLGYRWDMKFYMSGYLQQPTTEIWLCVFIILQIFVTWTLKITIIFHFLFKIRQEKNAAIIMRLLTATRFVCSLIDFCKPEEWPYSNRF